MDVINAFRRWYADADMPEKVNGRWVDLETGISFDPRAWMPKQPAPPQPLWLRETDFLGNQNPQRTSLEDQ